VPLTGSEPPEPMAKAAVLVPAASVPNVGNTTRAAMLPAVTL